MCMLTAIIALKGFGAQMHSFGTNTQAVYFRNLIVNLYVVWNFRGQKFVPISVCLD